jgi:subtilisin-like proprotein convertase family protein
MWSSFAGCESASACIRLVLPENSQCLPRVAAGSVAAPVERDRTKSPWGAIRSLIALLACLVAVLALPALATANIYSNPAAITINEADCSGGMPKKATPFPSNITVSGAPTVLDDVNVIIRGLTHSFPEDIRILLVDPGLRSVLLMHGAGGSPTANGVNLAFDDAAFGPIPTPIVSGTYRPTQIDTGCASIHPDTALPTPAPAGPYATTLSQFNGHDPNGIWSLYVAQSSAGSSGSIAGGWSLELSPSPPPESSPATTPPAQTTTPTPSRPKCKKKRGRNAAAAKKKCKKRK